MKTSERQTPRKPIDLLELAGGWLFFSFTTALALTSIFRNAGIATPQGMWSTLLELYSTIMDFVFGGLARLISWDRFQITVTESDTIGALALVIIPFATAHKLRGLLVFMSILLLIFLVVYGFDNRPDPKYLGISSSILGFVTGLALCGWEAFKNGIIWQYGRNFLGAALMLLALMATGFFEVGQA